MAEWIVEAETLEALENGFYAIGNNGEPVVRCKDCRYNYANMIPNGKGCQQNIYIEVDDNFFCADGEREDEPLNYHIENDGTYRGGENEKDSNSI